MQYIEKAYIHNDEIDFIRSFMDNTGTILEVGAYVGKTFHGLHQHRSEWDYVAVDPWETRAFGMDDPDKPFEHTNEYPQCHSKYFAENCPYATYFVNDYENILFTKNTFDVIVLSAASSLINFSNHYLKALDEVKEDGVIIGRYINHHKYGKAVRNTINALNPENYMEYNRSMFAIW